MGWTIRNCFTRNVGYLQFGGGKMGNNGDECLVSLTPLTQFKFC